VIDNGSPDSAANRAKRHDHVMPDHYPVCPSCGNLCGRLARICADCGVSLMATPGDLRDAAANGRMHRMPSADDATEATRETGP
jgi:ribosomal protein L32